MRRRRRSRSSDLEPEGGRNGESDEWDERGRLRYDRKGREQPRNEREPSARSPREGRSARPGHHRSGGHVRQAGERVRREDR